MVASEIEEVRNAVKIMTKKRYDFNEQLSIEEDNCSKWLVAKIKNVDKKIKDEVVQLLYKALPLDYPYIAIWWYSVLLNIQNYNDEVLFLEYVRYIRNKKNSFSINTLYYLFYQMKAIYFRFYTNIETKKEMWHFFKDIVEEFEKKIHVSLKPIPKKNRNNDRIIVIAEMFTYIQNGPTKTALDRCKALISLKKKVLLIHTAETLSQVGKIPLLSFYEGFYRKELNLENFQEWQGIKIPFYQCHNNMPNIETLDMLLQKIYKIAPAYIICIGGTSILSNLLNKMIPVITIGLGPSDLEVTTTKYQTLSRDLTEIDRQLLKELNFKETHIIKSIFTSGLKSQTEHITRKQLKLPENGFIIAIVGTRLDQEVTEEFLTVLENSLEENMYITFIGSFNNFEQLVSLFPRLYKQTYYLGGCEDILSRMEICDLYVNPKRRGGGTSCVEALFKGVPVVSLDYGDGAINVGLEFCVKNYQEMQAKIQQYYYDQQYYNIMSQKARERAEILLNTKKEFERILQEIDKREE